MEAGILGPLQITNGGRPVSFGTARKPRLMLAALLAHAGRPVSIDALTAALWEATPPMSARRNIQLYAHQLRRALGADRIRPHEHGYVFVTADIVDAVHFRQLADRGQKAAEAGDPALAARIWGAALALWRGPALAEFHDTRLVAAETRRLEELRVDVCERWARAHLAAGNPGRVVAELTALVREHPLRESSCDGLMRALYRIGRQAEALEAYRRIRSHLVEQLGIEPGPSLRRLHTAILRGDDSLILEPAPAAFSPVSEAAAVGAAVRPMAQLPPGVRDFTGRTAALATLDALAAEDGQTVIAAISGTPGVGKSALAIHWALSAMRAFPGGQLYLDLHGFDGGTPVPPAEALGLLLQALGVPVAEQPAGLQARASLFRGRTAGRRVLMLLDGARDAEQVRPLLPGAGGSLVLITSRNRLSGLAAEGASVISLTPLPAEEAQALLRARLGPALRAPDEPALDRVAKLCGGLPLALAAVAARVAAGPAALADIAAQLSTQDGLLDGLALGEARCDVRSALSRSYEALTPATARLFRLLSLHPGPEFGAPSAASLADVPLEEIRRSLAELAGGSLVDEVRPGRYTLSGLLGAYARELAIRTDSEADRQQASQRVGDHYVEGAGNARRAIDTADRSAAGLGSALAWLSAEREALIRVVQEATRTGRHGVAVRIASALSAYHLHIGRANDRVAGASARVRTARPAERVSALLSLGEAYLDLAIYPEAHRHLTAALDVSAGAGDHAALGQAHLALARLSLEQGSHDAGAAYGRQALNHFRAAGHRAGEAEALHTVAQLTARLGDDATAARLFGQAADLLLRIGDGRIEAAQWAAAGDSARTIGHHDQAIACYRQALELHRSAGDRAVQARIHIRLAETYAATGEPERAHESRQHALHILADIGDPAAATGHSLAAT